MPFDFIVMKRTLLLLFLSMVLFSCSNESRDEDVVKAIVSDFYQKWNEKEINEKLGGDLVVYESFNVREVDINGNFAVVEVECIDEFGNKVVCNWNLLKIDREWRLDKFENIGIEK